MANGLESYLNGTAGTGVHNAVGGTVLGRYCAGEDATWVEEQHHRADNGRFTSGSGRGKSKGDKEGSEKGGEKGSGGKSRNGEVEQDVAERAVREAFEKTGGGLASMKLIGHHLSVRTTVKKEEIGDKVTAINGHLKEHGLRAKLEDGGGTTLHVAEDADDGYDATNDPVTSVLVGLCAVGMLSKDLHYRAKGKPFYGMHELADVVFRVEKSFDDLNEIYYMGEKGVNPPERAKVAAAAARIAGTPGDEDALIAALVKMLGNLVDFIEQVKRGGVSSGTGAVLDDISKNSLQAKGLLSRTAKGNERESAIDRVIGKGIVLEGGRTGQDSASDEDAIYGDVSNLTNGGDVDAELASRYWYESGEDAFGEDGLESKGYSDYRRGLFLRHIRGSSGRDPNAIAAAIRESLGLRTSAQDEGTAEGARKGWETRKHGSGISKQHWDEAVTAMMGCLAHPGVMSRHSKEWGDTVRRKTESSLIKGLSGTAELDGGVRADIIRAYKKLGGEHPVGAAIKSALYERGLGVYRARGVPLKKTPYRIMERDKVEYPEIWEEV